MTHISCEQGKAGTDVLPILVPEEEPGGGKKVPEIMDARTLTTVRAPEP
jgi:hypothetical protein